MVFEIRSCYCINPQTPFEKYNRDNLLKHYPFLTEYGVYEDGNKMLIRIDSFQIMKAIVEKASKCDSSYDKSLILDFSTETPVFIIYDDWYE